MQSVPFQILPIDHHRHNIPQIIDNHIPPSGANIPFEHHMPNKFDNDRIEMAETSSASNEDDEQQAGGIFNFDMIEFRKQPQLQKNEHKPEVAAATFENIGDGVIDNISASNKENNNVQQQQQSSAAVFPQFQPRFPVINANAANWWSSADSPIAAVEWNNPSINHQFHHPETGIDQPMP